MPRNNAESLQVESKPGRVREGQWGWGEHPQNSPSPLPLPLLPGVCFCLYLFSFPTHISLTCVFCKKYGYSGTAANKIKELCNFQRIFLYPYGTREFHPRTRSVPVFFAIGYRRGYRLTT